MASTRSQSTRSTRSNKIVTQSDTSSSMEVDDVVTGLTQLSRATDFSKSAPDKDKVANPQNPSENIQSQSVTSLPPPLPNVNSTTTTSSIISTVPLTSTNQEYPPVTTNTTISSSANPIFTNLDTNNSNKLSASGGTTPLNNLLDAASSAMEIDQPEPPKEKENSSSDSSSSDSSDSSDTEDSSETDEETAAKNKVEDQEDLSVLEKMFTYAREVFYDQRMRTVTTKLDEVRSGRAKEYLGPLEQLQETMRVKIEITSNRREFRLQNLNHKFESEELAAEQNYENEKHLLYDHIKEDLEEKIRRLEEDRHNDFSSDFWFETTLKKKNKKSLDIFGEKKKKPAVVTGPYVVYMLNDVDIMEDWTTVKKALAAPRRKFVDPCGF